METQFILALFYHGYKARTSTLFHLLKGKHTSSVLLYGFLFDNLRFFGSFPDLSEKEYEHCLMELRKKEHLFFLEKGQAQLTEKGLKYLLSNSANSYSEYPCIDYFQFGKTDDECWRMLQFSVQITSYLSYGETHYVPLEQSPLFQQHIKKIIKNYPKKEFIQQIKTEWSALFSELSIEEANFFAHQFTGYQHIGQIPQQLINLEGTALNRQFFLKNRLHKLLSNILLREDSSILKQIIYPLIKQNENKSMNESLKYLNLGYTLEEISTQRTIKTNTVKDHFLEASIIGLVESDQILDKSISNMLNQVQGPYQEWQYQELKRKINELDYFDFRLYQIKKKQLEIRSYR